MEITLNKAEIEKIISEKYKLNPQNGDAIAIVIESKTVNYNSVDARKEYYPIAYIWKEGGNNK